MIKSMIKSKIQGSFTRSTILPHELMIIKDWLFIHKMSQFTLMELYCYSLVWYHLFLYGIIHSYDTIFSFNMIPCTS